MNEEIKEKIYNLCGSLSINGEPERARKLRLLLYDRRVIDPVQDNTVEFSQRSGSSSKIVKSYKTIPSHRYWREKNTFIKIEPSSYGLNKYTSFTKTIYMIKGFHRTDTMKKITEREFYNELNRESRDL